MIAFPGRATKVASISVASALLISASASVAGIPSGSPLPPLPGADLTTRACTQCHSADVIAKRGRTPAEWRHTVDVMIRFGAKMNDTDKQEVIDYLRQAVPPTPKPAPAVGPGQ